MVSSSLSFNSDFQTGESLSILVFVISGTLNEYVSVRLSILPNGDSFSQRPVIMMHRQKNGFPDYCIPHKTVICHTRLLSSVFLQGGQIVSELFKKLLGLMVVSKAGQRHVKRIGIDADRFGKLFSAPLFVKPELCPEYVAFDTEIIDHDVSPKIQRFYGQCF